MDATAEMGMGAPGLRRTLRLHHLILYGIIIIQPTAPMSIYRVVNAKLLGVAWIVVGLILYVVVRKTGSHPAPELPI